MAAELQAALDALLNDLSNDERKSIAQCKTPTVHDVLNFTKSVDQKGSQRKLRALGSRFTPILEGIQNLTGVIDTFIQGGPDLAALIWGSIKFIVLLLSNFTEYLEKISDMFLKLGTVCPRLSSFQKVFPKSAGVQEAVLGFYATVILFCHKTLIFLRSATIKKIAKATWKPFKSEFKTIETKLLDQRDIINLEVQLASEYAAHGEREAAHIERQAAETERQEARAERLGAAYYRDQDRAYKLLQIQEWEDYKSQLKTVDEKTRRKLLLERICSHDPLSEFLRLREKREGEDIPADWFFNICQFRSWLNGNEKNVLWCHGIPGSGKSVLTTSVLDHLYNIQPSTTLISYFFCAFENKETLEMRTILESLLKQVIVFYNTQLPKEIWEALKMAYGNVARKPALRDIQALLIKVLNLRGAGFVVIDGVDECSVGTQHSFMNTFKHISSVCMKVRFFISSRTDLSLRRVIIGTEELNLDLLETRSDIESFVKRRIAERVDTGDIIPLDTGLLEEIQTELTKHAHGMFLWVDLQIQDICRQLTKTDIRKLLKSLPRDLDKTFERILRRIIDERLAPMAVKVFKWLSCARRPLTLDELAEAVSLESNDKHYFEVKERIPEDKSRLIHNCGNLVVQRDADSTVHFAHFTVKEYLDRRSLKIQQSSDLSLFLLDLGGVDQELGLACMAYMTFSDFEQQVTVRQGITGNSAIAKIGENLVNSRDLWVPAVAPAHRTLGWFWHLASSTYSFITRGGNDLKRKPILDQITFQPGLIQKLAKQYSLLEYVATNWIFHCSNVPSETRPEETFKNLLFGPGPPFPYKPWLKFSEKYHPREAKEVNIFRWAIDNEHVELINFLIRDFPASELFKTQFQLANGQVVSTLERICDMRSTKLFSAFGSLWGTSDLKVSRADIFEEYFENCLLSKDLAFADAMRAWPITSPSPGYLRKVSDGILYDILVCSGPWKGIFKDIIWRTPLGPLIDHEGPRSKRFASLLKLATERKNPLAIKRLLAEPDFRIQLSDKQLCYALHGLASGISEPEIQNVEEDIIQEILKTNPSTSFSNTRNVEVDVMLYILRFDGDKGFTNMLRRPSFISMLRTFTEVQRHSFLARVLGNWATIKMKQWDIKSLLGVAAVDDSIFTEYLEDSVDSGDLQMLIADYSISDLQTVFLNLLKKYTRDSFLERNRNRNDTYEFLFEPRMALNILIRLGINHDTKCDLVVSTMEVAMEQGLTEDVLYLLLDLGGDPGLVLNRILQNKNWSEFEASCDTSVLRHSRIKAHPLMGNVVHCAVTLWRAKHLNGWNKHLLWQHNTSRVQLSYDEYFASCETKFPRVLVEAKDTLGRTPFLYAVHMAVTAYFRDASCDKEFESRLLIMLLDCGCDVNAKDNNGRTALMELCKFLRTTFELGRLFTIVKGLVLQLRISHNANPYLRDVEGFCADDYIPPTLGIDLKNFKHLEGPR